MHLCPTPPENTTLCSPGPVGGHILGLPLDQGALLMVAVFAALGVVVWCVLVFGTWLERHFKQEHD